MPKEIYNHAVQYARIYKEHVEESKTLSKANKSVLIDFADLLKAEKLSFARRKKLLTHLIQISGWLKTDFDKATKEDLIKLVAAINEKPYAPWSLRDFKLSVKKLYQTISSLDKYKSIEPLYYWLYEKRNKFYSTAIDKRKAGLDSDWFTEDDIKILIRCADNVRDRCFCILLATQGLRPEEILTLKTQDVIIIDNGFQIKISKGKTGIRTIFIYETAVVNSVADYLPTIPKEQEYLFNFRLRNAQKLVKNLAEKSGIKKRVYLYKFRKFSVTKDRILGVSQGALESKYGWIKGTGVLSHYDKSISMDYQKEMQQKYGIVRGEAPKMLADKICLRCGDLNAFDKIYCNKCGLRLNITREELMQNVSNSEKEINELKIRIEKLEKWDALLGFFAKKPEFKVLVDKLVP